MKRRREQTGRERRRLALAALALAFICPLSAPSEALAQAMPEEPAPAKPDPESPDGGSAPSPEVPPPDAATPQAENPKPLPVERAREAIPTAFGA